MESIFNINKDENQFRYKYSRTKDIANGDILNIIKEIDKKVKKIDNKYTVSYRIGNGIIIFYNGRELINIQIFKISLSKQCNASIYYFIDIYNKGKNFNFKDILNNIGNFNDELSKNILKNENNFVQVFINDNIYNKACKFIDGDGFFKCLKLKFNLYDENINNFDIICNKVKNAFYKYHIYHIYDN